MFKSVKYLTYDADKNKYIYEIVDTCFVCEAPLGSWISRVEIGSVNAIISEYSRRNLNVTKSLVLYYKYLEKEYNYNLKKLIDDHKYWLDKYHPQLEFGKKYYKCILRAT